MRNTICTLRHVVFAIVVSMAGLTMAAATNNVPAAEENFEAQTFVLKYAKATEEPDDYTREELLEMYRQNEKPNKDIKK